MIISLREGFMVSFKHQVNRHLSTSPSRRSKDQAKAAGKVQQTIYCFLVTVKIIMSSKSLFQKFIKINKINPKKL